MKRATLHIILCLSLLSGMPAAARAQDGLGKRVDELAQQIAAKMTARQKTTVAVVEFTDLQGRTTDFGRFLAEELITRLMETEKFRVIERQLLNKVIAEQKLSLTGVVDPASARQLGKILGVEAVVAGTVTNLSQSVKVNARLISTETGEIFSVASAEIFKDESVTGLLNNGGSMPAGAKPAPPQPDPSKQTSRRLTIRDFVFELQACRVSGGRVTCSFTVTNESPADRVLQFNVVSYGGPRSRMFDEFGAEYVSEEIHIGSHGSHGLRYVSNSLVPQVPTKLRVFFENVNAEAKTITLLRVAFVWEDSRAVGLSADFRNVPITR